MAVQFVVVVEDVPNNIIVVHPGITTNMNDVQLTVRADTNHGMNCRADFDVQIRDVVTATPITATDHPSVSPVESLLMQPGHIAQRADGLQLFSGQFSFTFFGGDTEDFLNEFAGPANLELQSVDFSPTERVVDHSRDNDLRDVKSPESS